MTLLTVVVTGHNCVAVRRSSYDVMFISALIVNNFIRELFTITGHIMFTLVGIFNAARFL